MNQLSTQAYWHSFNTTVPANIEFIDTVLQGPVDDWKSIVRAECGGDGEQDFCSPTRTGPCTVCAVGLLPGWVWRCEGCPPPALLFLCVVEKSTRRRPYLAPWCIKNSVYAQRGKVR